MKEEPASELTEEQIEAACAESKALYGKFTEFLQKERPPPEVLSHSLLLILSSLCCAFYDKPHQTAAKFGEVLAVLIDELLEKHAKASMED